MFLEVLAVPGSFVSIKYRRILEQECRAGYGPALSRHFVGQVCLTHGRGKPVNIKEAEAIVLEVKI
jgi:hypothetical protein